MSEEKNWVWKSQIIDFEKYKDEKVSGQYYTKIDYVFRYLGVPDADYHKWYNGGYSSEYNEALSYAYELGLVENYKDYEDEIYDLQQQNKDLQERIEKAKDKLQKYIMEDFDDMHICLMQELLEILEKKEVE